MKFAEKKIYLLNFVVLVFVNVLTGRGQSVEQLIAEGDEYAEKKFDNDKALETYTKAASLRPDNYDILWRICRAYVNIMVRSCEKRFTPVANNDRNFILLLY